MPGKQFRATHAWMSGCAHERAIAVRKCFDYQACSLLLTGMTSMQTESITCKASSYILMADSRLCQMGLRDSQLLAPPANMSRHMLP